jgi:CRP-like cAMP-binding protein
LSKNKTSTNRLLASLSEADLNDISNKMERVPLDFGSVIYESGALIDHVYFPESGIISLLSPVDKNSSLELGLVGNEGFAGLPVFLGVSRSQYRAVVQGSGNALRMPANEFLQECEDKKSLSAIVRHYIHSFITQISQSAACNRFHSIEERMARWLLMTHDRMQVDEFQITHEFLSNMLGVRREAVTRGASELQRKGIISYSRGKLTVIDRNELEKAACRCYEMIKNEGVSVEGE